MEHSFQPTLGALLKAAREHAGYSIRGLAAKSGVDQANITRIEHGQRTNPQAETVLKLAHALQVDPGPWLARIGVDPGSVLPTTRTYFRRKLGVDADEADVLARLVEDYQAGKGGRR